MEFIDRVEAAGGGIVIGPDGQMMFFEPREDCYSPRRAKNGMPAVTCAIFHTPQGHRSKTGDRVLYSEASFVFYTPDGEVHPINAFTMSLN